MSLSVSQYFRVLFTRTSPRCWYPLLTQPDLVPHTHPPNTLKEQPTHLV